MKHLSTSLKAIVVASLACTAGLAAAADSQTLVVTATVQAVCKFVSVPAIAFTIDPSLTGNQTGTSSVTYHCTKGQSPTFGTGTGALTGRTLICLLYTSPSPRDG